MKLGNSTRLAYYEIMYGRGGCEGFSLQQCKNPAQKDKVCNMDKTSIAFMTRYRSGNYTKGLQRITITERIDRF